MRSAIKLLTVVMALATAPAAAHAEDPTSDPDAGSPSGTIYEIPLDDGRNDAAPRGGGDNGNGGTNAGGGRADRTEGGSPIHSENNFGSSSIVPGTEDAAAAQADGAAAGSSDGSRDRAADRRDRDKDEADRKADEERADGLTAAQERAARANAASVAAPGPSMSRSLLLIGLGIAVAVGLGVGAARHAAGRR